MKWVRLLGLPLTLLAAWLLVVESPRVPRPGPGAEPTGTPSAEIPGPTEGQSTPEERDDPLNTPDASFDQSAKTERIFKALEGAERVTLVSLDPVDMRDWRRLGEVTLQGEEKTRVVAAVRKSVEGKRNGMRAMCFEPRHALEAEGVVNVTICFACAQAYARFPSGESVGVLLTGSANPLLNKVLRSHDIPLAKH